MPHSDKQKSEINSMDIGIVKKTNISTDMDTFEKVR